MLSNNSRELQLIFIPARMVLAFETDNTEIRCDTNGDVVERANKKRVRVLLKNVECVR